MSEANEENYKKSKRKKKNTFSNILLIFFTSLLIYSSYNIFIWYKNNSINQTIKQELAKTVKVDTSKEVTDAERFIVDFEELKNKNKDTVAYINVKGTDIDYSVVKTTDNNYYLSHNFNKEKNNGGWVFLDYRNKLDGTDKNIIIYAHNMKDGSMFGTLKNALTKEWYEKRENRYINFVTENKKAVYEVFSVYEIPNEEYYTTITFNEGEFGKFIKKIKDRSSYSYNTIVTPDNNILTLSTCGSTNKYRVVMHAKEITSLSKTIEKQENNIDNKNK